MQNIVRHKYHRDEESPSSRVYRTHHTLNVHNVEILSLTKMPIDKNCSTIQNREVTPT